MTRHDCPDCHCDEQPECAEGHCMHLGADSYPTQVWFCCRCPYNKTEEINYSEMANDCWPPPGCKLHENVVIT